ncbi:MAG: hypothetical protein HOH74_16395 [Gemmatimonadetes bacterium]|nr:hypothetical protein [Gemmatimonadota bacterium]
MCLILLDHGLDPGVGLVLGANREEAYARPSQGPDWRPDPPVFSGLDVLAGGTWLGVSQAGLVVAITNRREAWQGPSEPRSRGQLCYDTLRLVSAAEALDWAVEHLADHGYRPCNLLIPDALTAGVIHVPGRPERRDLSPGRYVLTDGDIDDPNSQRVARAMELTKSSPAARIEDRLTQMERILADADPDAPDRERICRRGETSGTVSACVLALSEAGLDAAQYRYAAGPPDTHCFHDLSTQLQRGH